MFSLEPPQCIFEQSRVAYLAPNLRHLPVAERPGSQNKSTPKHYPSYKSSPKYYLLLASYCYGGASIALTPSPPDLYFNCIHLAAVCQCAREF